MSVWYSICWTPRNFNNPNSFIELDGCPRFYLSHNESEPNKHDLEHEYPNLFVKEIFKTQIFVKDPEGVDMPTHYRHGIFVPGQNKAYDVWLEKSFGVNKHILEKISAREELYQKKVFLEYSNKIIRHDMHSGINTYLPRGLAMLKKRLDAKTIEEFRLKSALEFLERGLAHTQMVYQGVYAFTSLVKENPRLETSSINIKKALDKYLVHTAYKNSIVKVRTYKTTSKGRSTSTAVHSYAIQRSKGICESCDTPAPFETRNGTPYLEVHHLIPISKGGPDHPENVAAVCPNCHRRTEKSKDSDQFNNDIIKKVLAKEKEMGKV